MSPKATAPIPVPATPPSLADAVLSAASHRFQHGGVDALSVRAIAADAGCTTMAVYTHFGGKDGLLQYFFDEGFGRLSAEQRAVPETLAPRERVAALCRAYRRIAHTFPHHYDLMLGAHSGRFTPAPESRRHALNTIDYLVNVLALFEAPGAALRERAQARAHALIAFCHGWVMLERAGLYAVSDETTSAFDQAVGLLIAPAVTA
ncbi:TetR/AcrR family transcriptional regulator [Gemmatimonas phototrophica]|uniref:TetR/AcrR family transcriptional regulator n=1 Tax=Gemmatimonas phototrophica TaxID=1379270 RepID=UPI0006A70B06|nr:WHG domain-containing protein [Gemmatimonas phototrophica]